MIRRLHASLNKSLVCVSTLGFLVTSTLGFAAEAEKPNILFIIADDLGYDSLGCTGNPLEGLSPNVDKLASESLLIDHCFITTPICGPSRNSIYSGLHPHSSGYMGHGSQPPLWWKNKKRPLAKKSITSELFRNGYQTGIVGKHGTRWCKFSVKPYTHHADTGMGRNPERFYQFTKDFLEKAKAEGKPFYLAANTSDPHRHWPRHKDESPRWIKEGMHGKEWQALENGKPYPDPLTQYQPEAVPVPASYPKEKKILPSLATYYDAINRMDQIVGVLLKALEETGQADNTIVVFMSDHGMAWDFGKWSLYPSGTRTPFIIRWPGKIKANTRNETSIISAVDVTPTLLDLCGLDPIENTDGKSFKSLTRGSDSPSWKRRYALSSYNYMNNAKEFDKANPEFSNDLAESNEQYRQSRAINTTKFCYVWNGWSDGERELPRTMRGELSFLLEKASKNPSDSEYDSYDERLAHLKRRAPEELYDVQKDPGCRNNLANNPEYAETIARLRKTMLSTMQKGNDHELENYKSTLGKR